MWFKHIYLLEFEQKIPYEPEQLASSLAEHPFKSCSALHPITAGFIPPIGDKNDKSLLVYAQQGYMMLCLQIQEKILPASVIREETQLQIKQNEEKIGTKLNRDERDRIKDELTHTLLTKAFHRTRQIYAYIDTKTQRLIIDSNHSKTIELLMKHLDNILRPYKPRLIDYRCMSSLLTTWLKSQQYPSTLSILPQAAFEQSNEQKMKMSFSNKDLSAQSVQHLLDEGAYLTRLRLDWSGKIQFTVKQPFALTSLKFLDEIRDLAKDGQPSDANERFAADFFIMAETIHTFLEETLPLWEDANPTKVENTILNTEAI